MPAGLEARLTTVWIAALAVGAATITIKATGPVLLAGRELPPRVLAVVELLAPALLDELRALVTEAEVWVRAERPGARAEAATDRCRLALDLAPGEVAMM